MITLETVLALALRDPVVMDQLGTALRNDLVVANPWYRRLVEFADDFLQERRVLPGTGDWQMWLEGLDQGMVRDATAEALGRLTATPTAGFDSTFFATQALEILRRGAAQVARARLNELGVVEPEAFAALAEKLSGVAVGGLQGLARLADVETWVHASREDSLVSTGYPTLDGLIGGWGKELWILFADSGVGKSMALQNFATNAAVRGKRVLHVTLEIGLGPQIRRYYRQIAQAFPGEVVQQEAEVVRRLRHWFRMASGEILLLEFPAYSLTPKDLQRQIAILERSVGHIDVLVLDYLDLLVVGGKGGGRNQYEDLGRLTHESRALCGKFDLTVLTASQAVRRPERKGHLSVRDMGDSYGKVRGADGLLSLVQTEEEEEVHQGRFGILKVRDSGGRGREIQLYVNRELAMIQEYNHPNTIELMRRLGHLPPAEPVVTLTKPVAP